MHTAPQYHKRIYTALSAHRSVFFFLHFFLFISLSLSVFSCRSARAASLPFPCLPRQPGGIQQQQSVRDCKLHIVFALDKRTNVHTRKKSSVCLCFKMLTPRVSLEHAPSKMDLLGQLAFVNVKQRILDELLLHAAFVCTVPYFSCPFHFNGSVHTLQTPHTIVNDEATTQHRIRKTCAYNPKRSIQPSS